MALYEYDTFRALSAEAQDNEYAGLYQVRADDDIAAENEVKVYCQQKTLDTGLSYTYSRMN